MRTHLVRWLGLSTAFACLAIATASEHDAETSKTEPFHTNSEYDAILPAPAVESGNRALVPLPPAEPVDPFMDMSISPSLSEEHADQVRHAFNAFRYEYPVCAYTQVTLTNDDPAKVERFTPTESKTNEWSLLAVGDNPPSPKELENYEHQGESLYPPDLVVTLAERLKGITLQRSDATSSIYRATMTPNPPDTNMQEGILEELAITFEINSERDQLIKLEAKINNTYRPNALFSASKFEQRYFIDHNSIISGPLLKNFKMEMKARLMVVKKIDVDFESHIKDFYCPDSIQPNYVEPVLNEPPANVEQNESSATSQYEENG